MPANKKKYYVVWNGVTPGVYNTWTDCQIQIKGYPGAQYKSYTNKEDAEKAYQNGPSFSIDNKRTSKKKSSELETPTIPPMAIAVDAACSGNPGVMEYQGVLIKDGTLLFHFGPIKKGTNNIGEFLALVHALAMLEAEKSPRTTIYTDSRTALAWVRKKKANTKLKHTAQTKSLFNLIARAETWLKNNSINHEIIKWDTKKWGEIPADFGRK